MVTERIRRPKRSAMSRIAIGLVKLVVVASIGVGAVWALQRKLIYFPVADVPRPAAVGLPNAEDVSFTTSDGVTLHGWFVPPASPRAPETVLVFNGNAGNRGFRAALAAMLADAGLATLLFDYRGYGENQGQPSEEGLAHDAEAAYRYVAARKDVDASRLVYFGESLGAGVAVRLAATHAPRALILRSPFTSLIDVGRHHYPFLPVRTLLSDRFASIDCVDRLSCPLLVIAAARDSVVPSEQSRRLYEAARPPKHLVIIEGVDHNDYELLAGPRMRAEILQFLHALQKG
jgi:fermentation-respiration switch protein FrsA (DUF1100 family)